MTLPEVLIAITVLGILLATISTALIVTLRQQSSTEGRLNVARSEQSIGMWLPGDLASAAAISVEPDWTPCGHIEVDGEWVETGDVCPPSGLPAGSNALMLGWSYKDADGNVTYTNLSYYFYQDSDGTFSLAGGVRIDRWRVDVQPPRGSAGTGGAACRHDVDPGRDQAFVGDRDQPALGCGSDERDRAGGR